MDTQTRTALLSMQLSEITEYHIYKRLAAREPEPANRKVLQTIAADEMRHYRTLEALTGEQPEPDMFKVRLFALCATLFGITFTLRLMESGESRAQRSYRELSKDIPEIANIDQDEEEHEQQLISMYDEDRLKYVSSIVLGLNDALVELTGAIAGFTLALRDTDLIAMVGLVTGISASLSMAASEYLSTKEDVDTQKHPLKAAIYTGVTYFSAVVILVLPFLLLSNPALAVAWTLVNALLIIAVFTFYNSVSRNQPFRRSYMEMAAISMGVAMVSFLISFVVREALGVDV
ncbi:MAG: VIT1/CCC1 transporter family protein [Oceanidesulfovibrio sp.]